MKIFKGLMAAALVLAPALPGMAAPPTNQGTTRALNHHPQRTINRQQQRTQRSIGRQQQLQQQRQQQRQQQQQGGRAYGQQLRQQRTLNLTQGGRPDNPGRSASNQSTTDTQRGSARSALVNHGQNRLARINADKILANRLAQVARLRDVALNTNNDKLMARADQLEKLAKSDYDRRTGDSSGSSSDSGTTDPSTTDPSTTDPSTTDPSTTDPSTTDPSTTDPSTTDPGTTDPGTTTSTP